MELNEERNIVLRAFYYDLDKGHRINESRIINHLKTKTNIDHDRINTVILDLEKEGYIERIFATLGAYDFKITQKGERLIEEHGRFGEWKQPQQPAIVNNFYTEGGHMIGNTMGNQFLGDFFDNKIQIVEAATPPDTAAMKSQSNEEKNFIRKIWRHIYEHKAISSIIAGLIVSCVTYSLIKPYFEAKHNSPQNQSATHNGADTSTHSDTATKKAK